MQRKNKVKEDWSLEHGNFFDDDENVLESELQID
jgi:hypothetical protein